MFHDLFFKKGGLKGKSCRLNVSTGKTSNFLDTFKNFIIFLPLKRVQITNYKYICALISKLSFTLIIDCLTSIYEI